MAAPSRWLAKIDRGLSESEEAAFRAWLAQDKDNADRLLKLAALWDRMDSLSRLSALFPVQRTSPDRQHHVAAAAIAASILVFAAIFWRVFESGFLAPWATPSAPMASAAQLYETRIGQQSSISLPDGSRLTLNTDSHAVVDFSRTERKLVLERGEIHVAVAKDEARPLRVYAGARMIEALGTAFNVEMVERDAIELIVTEGVVRIAMREDRARERAATSRQESVRDRSLLVSAGHQAEMMKEATNVADIAPQEIESRLSWREGALVFRGETLGAALAEIARYTDQDFEIVDSEIGELRIVGRFRTGDTGAFLSALTENLGVSHYQNAEGVILLRRDS